MTSAANASEVIVQLLDPNHDKPLKTWKFRERAAITIGRAEDQDVEIVDSYVSRSHAILERRGGQWILTSRGRNGVFVNNQAIQEHPIAGDLAFRLGATGPKLAFKTCQPQDEHLATLCFETMPMDFFALDQKRLNQEVSAIAEGDDFQRLQQQAQSLRRRKAES